MAVRRMVRPALFVCDLQEKFRTAIWEFPRILDTTQKMIKASHILNIPVYATTQKRASLGNTCSELAVDKVVDKTAFSMWVPEIQSALSSGPHEVAIVGIESHICVTQTTLDLLANGHKVFILSDGVSSCNKEEIPIALRRLAREGAIIVTSESFLYECMGDADIAEFKGIAGLVKETSKITRETVQTLCKI